MFKIEFNNPTEQNPFGVLFARSNFADLGVDCPYDYPLAFSVYNSVSGQRVWSSDLFAGSWSSFVEPCNTYAVITDKNQNVIVKWEWDTFQHGDDAHILFMLWALKNKGAKGISIGTHDGSTGEWVEPLRQGLIEAFLVEASITQYKSLVNNFKSIPGCFPLLSLITTDGGDCEFFEGPDGFTNSVIKEHTLNYTSSVTSTLKKSRSLNDLICEVGLSENLGWLHLDVEGIDADLILSLDDNRIKLPDFIIYESLNLSNEKKQEVYRWLSNKGYLYKESGWNTIAHKKTI